MNQVLYFPQGVVYKWRLKGDGYQGFCGIKVTKVIIVQSRTLEGRGVKNDLQVTWPYNWITHQTAVRMPNIAYSNF
jgi:hypothetical protein